MPVVGREQRLQEPGAGIRAEVGENIADALTKGIPSESHALIELMRSNRLTVQPHGWVSMNNLNIEKPVSVDQSSDG